LQAFREGRSAGQHKSGAKRNDSPLHLSAPPTAVLYTAPNQSDIKHTGRSV
jgi:hypothetical protein